MFYMILLAMAVGWYEGGKKLYNTHHGIESGIQPSANLLGFLFLDQRTQ